MNLLEHWILEVREVKEEYVGNNKYIVPTMLVDCYGQVSESHHMFTEKEWKQSKKDGYYLG